MSNLVYMGSDYYATGEGVTVSLLVARPIPTEEDIAVPSKLEKDDTGVYVYVPPVLRDGTTERTMGLRLFIKEFDSWQAQGVRFFTREQFLEEYSAHVPTSVRRILEDERLPPGFSWKQQLYVNYS